MTKPQQIAVPPYLQPKRKPNGQYLEGYSGNAGFSGNRARKELNADTIRELHKAFRRGGAHAINRVMRTNPAMFLKLLVLLVPRELQVEHSGGVKAMTDEQLERGIELIREMIAKRDAAANAKLIEHDDSPVLPQSKAKSNKAKSAST